MTDLTVAQVAKELQVHPTTVRSLLVAGEIPGAFKIRTRWRVPNTALDDYRDQQKAIREDPWVRTRPRKDGAPR